MAVYDHPVCWVLIEFPTARELPPPTRTLLDNLHKSRLSHAVLSVNAALDGRRYLIKVAVDPAQIGAVGNVTRIFTPDDHHEAVAMVAALDWTPAVVSE